MNKTELIASIADKTQMKKFDVEKVIDAFCEVVEKTLSDKDEIRLIGFGTFATAVRKATSGRNPRTGKTITIPERIVPKFKPGKQLRDAVN